MRTPIDKMQPSGWNALSYSEGDEIGVVPRRRVLVVDDNPDVTESLSLLLTLLQVEVRVAHNGEDAIRLCEAWSPTHVLMDLGMPGMDGYEAGRRLSSDYPDRAFRLVALSGWGREEDRERTRQAGFDEHLVKPAGVAQLEAVLGLSTGGDAPSQAGRLRTRRG